MSHRRIALVIGLTVTVALAALMSGSAIRSAMLSGNATTGGDGASSNANGASGAGAQGATATGAGNTALGASTPGAATSGASPDAGLAASAQTTGTGALPFAFYPAPITASTQVTKFAQQFAASPAVGISWRFRWADLEPSPGSFDWRPIDNAMRATQATHKRVILRVIAGLYSPSWVIAKSQTVSVSNLYFPNTTPYANPSTLPVPWNSTYLADWSTFIHAFGARYDGNGAIYVIELSGGGDIGDMYLPPDMHAWNLVGYSDAKLQGAWQHVISGYAGAFKRTPVDLNITESLTCSAVSAGFTNKTCVAGWHSNVLTPLSNWVMSTYPGKVWMQSNGLNPNYAQFPNCPMRVILRSASAAAYQLNGEMASVTALHQTFTVARDDHARFVEIYPDNITNTANAAVIHYLRYG
jgi:hypothetical protein